MLLTNAILAAMNNGSPYGLVNNGAACIEGEAIKLLGSQSDIPDETRTDEIMDREGRSIIPGLVGCHTKLVFGNVEHIHFSGKFLTPEGRPDKTKIEPFARMGYYDYTCVRDVFEMRIPNVSGVLKDVLEGRFQ